MMSSNNGFENFSDQPERSLSVVPEIVGRDDAPEPAQVPVEPLADEANPGIIRRTAHRIGNFALKTFTSSTKYPDELPTFNSDPNRFQRSDNKKPRSKRY